MDADVGAFRRREAGWDAVFRSMNVRRREAPAQGLRGSLLDARRPLRSAQSAVEFATSCNS